MSATRNTLSPEYVEKNWEVTKMPDFGGRKALVLGGAFSESVVTLMEEAKCTITNDLDEADLVVFVGGSDISPALYGDKQLPQTFTNPRRDDMEKMVFEKCREMDIPMFGICRGHQLLAALCGAKLWQHVEGHGGYPHMIYDTEEDVFVEATSMHHQMVQNHPDMDVVAVTKDQVSKNFYADGEEIHLNAPGSNSQQELEIEAFYFKEKGVFGVQGHPEVGKHLYRTWCMTKLYDFILDWEEKISQEPTAKDYRGADMAETPTVRNIME